MNCIEFKSVMEEIGLEKTYKTITGKTGNEEDIYKWFGFEFYFSGSYYAVINGKFPLEVEQKLYDKYPNYEYGIRYNGGNASVYPTHSVKTYHVDTKEGLIMLFTELHDYYKENLFKTPYGSYQVDKQDEYIYRINKKLVKDLNLSLDNSEWKIKNNIFNLRDKKCDNFDLKIRKLLEIFDQEINPFSHSDVDSVEFLNYTDKLRLSFFKGMNNEVGFGIKKINDLNSIIYQKNSVRLNYEIEYYTCEFRITIRHYYNIEQQKEFLAVEIDDLINGYHETRDKVLIYDLIHNNLSRKDKKIIIDQLKSAIVEIRDITLDNMQVSKSRSLGI